jgi:hypothetical protein
MQTVARQAIWHELSQQMHMGQSRRKDLAGFHDHINVESTMAASSLAKQWKICEKIWRQMHLTLVSGSVMAGDRLHARREIENDECPLDGCRHTAEHLLWECTAFDCIRRPFIMQIGDIIGQAVHKGLSVSSYISEIHDSKPFRNCGIVHGDDEAIKYAESRHGKFVLMPPVETSMLIHEDSCKHSITVGGIKYGIVFTDGSVVNPRSKWLVYAGWGIFTGDGAQANVWVNWKGRPSQASARNCEVSLKPSAERQPPSTSCAITKLLLTR